jgi:hypothetical protein
MAFSISRTSNFYIKKLSADIDSAIVGLASNDNATKKIFSTMTPNGNCCAGDSSTDPVNPVFIRSSTCWAKNIDTSPISVWNNGGGYAEPLHAGGFGGTGILISPRHIVFNDHFQIKIGKKLIFVDMNDNCYIRTLTNSLQVGTSDIRIGLLDSDLPSNVSFCQVPSLDLSKKITSNIKIPLLYTDQSRSAFIGNTNNGEEFGDLEDAGLPADGSIQFLRQADDPQRTKFWYTLVFGDSGNPACFVYNNKLILLLHFKYANGGFCSPFYINEINSVMNTLGGGYNLSIFNTEDIDPIVNSILIKKQNLGSGKIQLYKFLPNRLQGLSLWLKADAGVTLSGSDVTAWADQSENGNNATAAAAYRPTFVSTDAQFNNKPSILFNGDGNSFVIPSINFDINANNSIFVAFRVSDGTIGTFLTQGGEGNYFLGMTNSALNISNSNVVVIILAGVVSNGEKYIVSATNNNHSFTLYQNGSQVGNTTFYNGFDGGGTKMLIGGDTTPVNNGQADSYFLNGKIAEIIVYDTAVTTSERQQVEAYLNAKYAIY